MRMRNVLTLFAAALALLCAQARVSAQGPHGLEVSEARWKYLTAGEESNFPRSRSSVGPSMNFSTATVATHSVSALFRNVGAKAVKSVTWEYVFFEDAARTRVLRHYKFRSGKRLGPGESARLEAWSLRPRASEYGAVRVTRVVYEDGSSWRSPKVKN